MHDAPRVLVVGTTSDYIEWIRGQCPERALFLTDPLIRHKAQETNPAPHEEVLCDLSGHDAAKETLKHHLRTWGLSLDGIASFDCESMKLAALLAYEFSLPYPSAEAIGNCRDKSISKMLWRQWGIDCPRSRLLVSKEDAAGFHKEMDGPCVLKPVSGSGSELVFYCESGDECEKGCQEILEGLKHRRSHRLYNFPLNDGPVVLAEEFIAGEEFSCDFIMENGGAEVIRISRKIPDRQSPFGTARGYILPALLPAGIDPTAFRETLYQSAKALGLTRAICMVDFLIRNNAIVLLEMSPRPGGDCLPFLMRQRWGLDILKLNLDFAQHMPIHLPPFDDPAPFIGLRLHAPQNGILKRIDTAPLHQDPRVREIHLPHASGHVIKRPPADYESWFLGHIIFEPHKDTDLETQCAEILDKVTVEVE